MMQIEITEALWLDTGHRFSLEELAAQSGLPADILRQLMELDALSPLDAAVPDFDADCLALACTASRLHHDLDLDAGALALVLRLLERVRSLEAEMQTLRARLPHHSPYLP